VLQDRVCYKEGVTREGVLLERVCYWRRCVTTRKIALMTEVQHCRTFRVANQLSHSCCKRP
jgi:hypothetical protein